MPDTIIRLENISKSYSQGDTVIPVIENLNVTIQEGKFISVIGPSGSGKSTLLNVIGLIDTADSGDIFFFNENLKDINDVKQNLIRRDKIGFVYQSNNLFSDFTAIENVTIPQLLLGANKKDAYNSAFKCLDILGLSARINHLPKDLSGGEQQRVAIARAIINEPKIIIADEPTGNLDKNTSNDVFEHLINFVYSQKISLIMATHNLDLARKSDHQIKLV
jgi:lipoprotein-releasing system ATP-binding protein|tara:strand:- start:70 stop:729 length:660 start_codon:yes stop_codon:yes gene_type:complete